jgi:aryl-alcohol dehydrogenase-like predicted oxidoreductase
VIVATKFLPYPWRLLPNALETALKRSLNRLGRPQVELYQIHWPMPPISMETRARQLVRVVQAGLAKTVGVSNYSANQMRRTSAVLNDAGIPLASNQVEYSLLNRKVERNGVWETCRKEGITLIAYSPLGKGMLSGKYTPENPPQGARSRQYTRNYLARIQPLIRLMREIGQAHDSKSSAQVAINWCICKGAVPIPGAKTTRQMQENAGALGWRLNADEMDALDRLSQDLG